MAHNDINLTPATKLRGQGSKLTADVRSHTGYLYCEFDEISQVDVAECCPTIEDFD